MADLTQAPDERLPTQDGMLVSSDDWAQLQANIDTAVGEILDALGGPNFNVIGSPLQVTSSGSGLGISIGGTGQRVIAQGRLVDVCPAQTITLNPANTSERLDAIYIKATRVPGFQSITRNLRSPSTPAPIVALTVQLVAGTATLPFGATYVSPPAVFPAPVNADGTAEITVSNITTTGCILTSTDTTDARMVTVLVAGSVVNAAGAPTTFTLLESTAAYFYVAGTPGSSPVVGPPPDATWDLFATIDVHANATSISSANITLNFPTLTSPITAFACTTLTVSKIATFLSNLVIDGNLTVVGNSTTDGNATVDGALSVLGSAVFAALTATVATFAGLATFESGIAVTGGVATDTLTATGAISGASLSIGGNVSGATASISGAATLGSLIVAGATTLAGLVAGAVTLASAAISGALSAASASIAGTVTAASVVVSGALTAASAAVSGTLTAASAVVSGALSAASLAISGTSTLTGSVTTGGNLTVGGSLIASPLSPMVCQRISGGSTITLTLPVLPSGSWTLYARAYCDLGSGHTMTLAGGGTGASWEGTSSVSDQPGIEAVELIGTSTGGGAPTATLTFPSGGPSGAYDGIFLLMASR